MDGRLGYGDVGRVQRAFLCDQAADDAGEFLTRRSLPQIILVVANHPHAVNKLTASRANAFRERVKHLTLFGGRRLNELLIDDWQFHDYLLAAERLHSYAAPPGLLYWRTAGPF